MTYVHGDTKTYCRGMRQPQHIIIRKWNVIVNEISLLTSPQPKLVYKCQIFANCKIIENWIVLDDMFQIISNRGRKSGYQRMISELQKKFLQILSFCRNRMLLSTHQAENVRITQGAVCLSYSDRETFEKWSKFATK